MYQWLDLYAPYLALAGLAAAVAALAWAIAQRRQLQALAAQYAALTVDTKGGSLAVVVNTTDGNGSFGFTSTALGDFAVTTSGGTGQKAFANLAPGVYDLNEVVTSGWDLGAASCSNGSNPATVSVAAGESVTCTFANTHVQTTIFFPIVAKK